MPPRHRFVLAAHVAAESAWVFALAGVVGDVAGVGSSPLSWYGAAGILGLSVVVSALIPRERPRLEPLYLLAGAIGFAAVYASVALHVEPGQLRPGWPIDWLADDAEGGYFSRGALGAAMGIALWWRGIRIGASEYPTDDLSLTFRLGMIAIVLALIYDLNADADLSTFPMVFIFFGSALLGLGAGHVLAESESSASGRTWPKTISVTVAGIALAGLLVALINRGILAFLSGPATTSLAALARGVIWAIVVPIAFVFDTITRWIINLVGVFNAEPDEDEPVFTGEAQRFLNELQREQEAASEQLTTLLQVVELLLVAIVVIVVAAFIARAFRRLLRGRAEAVEGSRDSLAGDADMLSDLGRLALRLAPDALKRRRARHPRPPKGPPGIVAPFRLYYEMLDAARDRGVERRKRHTPDEFRADLEREFPREVVRPSTDAFNLAMYGHVPADTDEVARLREALRSSAVEAQRRGAPEA